jgi:hypothetical protein
LIQTPATGEEHLLKLIRKDPRNAFLCTRLGNLFRSCGEQARASEWYEKALNLDPGDVEARYHLFSFAVNAEDVSAALIQGPPLVRYLLEGRKTAKDDLTEGIALSVVDNLLAAPESFRKHFLEGPAAGSNRKEEVFIRTLLAQEGDDDEILADAAERLLSGEAAPFEQETADVSEEFEAPAVDLVPSLRKVVESEGLDPKKLTVGLPLDNHRNVRIENRHLISVSDGTKAALWPVSSLRELFRGSRTPPPDIDRYPKEYCMYFYFIEEHVLTLCAAKGDRTDQELEEVYAMLRRRPDGKSLGVVHDFLWQVAALLLGRHVLSEAEFEAIFGQLERSVRHWALHPVSRNYVAYLRDMLEPEG